MMSENMQQENLEVATLAGGCFWCLEPIFGELRGVESSVSGYSGGRVPNPTYREVVSGRTGHAESVQVTFDPAVISYAQILRVFFTFHDPTTVDRQGNDVGPQYRSAIFYHDETQHESAQRIIEEINTAGIWGKPIVTEVTPFDKFFTGEDYHQNYYYNNPNQGYCSVIIAPKVAKFRKAYVDMLK